MRDGGEQANRKERAVRAKPMKRLVHPARRSYPVRRRMARSDESLRDSECKMAIWRRCCGNKGAAALFFFKHAAARRGIRYLRSAQNPVSPSAWFLPPIFSLKYT